jgi:predicted peptidase
MSFEKKILTSGSSPGPGYPNYGQAIGIRMAFLEHIPVPLFGSLPPLIIYLHGIDHRGPRPTSDIDFSTVHVVANKGVALLIRDAGAEIAVTCIPGEFTSIGNRKFAVLAPQCSSEFGTFPFAYLCEMIKYAKANLVGKVDLTRIYVVGYSFGAGLTVSVAKLAYVLDNVAAMFAIAPGYNNSPDYVAIANGGMPMYIYTTVTDQFTAILGIADTFVTSLNAQAPPWPVQYLRFAGTTTGTLNHDDIVITITKESPAGEAYSLSNGTQWIHSESIYATMLRHTLSRRKK